VDQPTKIPERETMVRDIALINFGIEDRDWPWSDVLAETCAPIEAGDPTIARS